MTATEIDRAEAAQKGFAPEDKPRLQKLRDAFDKIPSFDAASLEAALKATAAELGVKAGLLVHPVRLACTGNYRGLLLCQSTGANAITLANAADPTAKEIAPCSVGVSTATAQILKQLAQHPLYMIHTRIGLTTEDEDVNDMLED